jgi:hypothetical protein
VSAAQERRNRSNLYTLSGALLASFAVVLIIVILAIRPDPMTRAEVDWSDVHASAPNPQTLVNPQFTDADGDWWSNRAEYIGGDSIEWYIGLVTPSGEFVSIEQFLGTVPPELLDILDDNEPVKLMVAGSPASVVDRSMLKNPGNYERVYEFSMSGGGSLIVSGTADQTEMELVAQRALESLKG